MAPGAASGVEKSSAAWKLAEYLTKNNGDPIPLQSCRAIFQGVMVAAETIAQRKFDAALIKRVWKKVAREPLNQLKELFLSQFCEKVLGGFTEEQVQTMLDEQNMHGTITSHRQSLIEAQIRHKPELILLMKAQTDTITDSMFPKVCQAIRNEGV